MLKHVSLILLALCAICAWVLLYYIPQAMLFVPRTPLTSSPADVGLDYENILLRPADVGIELEAWWMPADDARAKLVFIHGGGSNRNSRYFHAIEFYRAMVDQGISVAAVDLRNHGNSDSDGNGLRFGLTEQHDAVALIDWVRGQSPDIPIYAMGISMGGATLIHAASNGVDLEGLILMDPLLDTYSAATQAVWVETGLPAKLFTPSAWAASQFYGIPSGAQGALQLAAGLDTPTLLMQDPLDPVTQAQHARWLASANPALTYRELPVPSEAQLESLADKGRWGSHVAGFILFPQRVVGEILDFMDSRAAASSPAI